MKSNKPSATFVLNVPNVLSLYRILVFPVLLYLIFTKREHIFVVLFCISLVTDILDGLIARLFKQETEFGARLDSVADVGSYIAAMIALVAFKWDVLAPFKYWFFGIIALFLVLNLTPLIRWRRLTSFHLYSSKIAGYVQGIWLFTVFVFGFNTVFFFVMVAATYLSDAEHLVIQSLLKKPATNLKGLYWVLKDRNSSSRLSS